MRSIVANGWATISGVQAVRNITTLRVMKNRGNVLNEKHRNRVGLPEPADIRGEYLNAGGPVCYILMCIGMIYELLKMEGSKMSSGLEAAAVETGLRLGFEVVGRILSDPEVKEELEELADETDTEVDDLVLDIVFGILSGMHGKSDEADQSDEA